MHPTAAWCPSLRNMAPTHSLIRQIPALLLLADEGRGGTRQAVEGPIFVDPVSLEDPSWPQALRTELADLKMGDLTGIIFLENRYALARVERILPADGVEFESVRAELERSARLSQERLKMAELAGRLGVLPRVRILDAELRRAWAVDESAAEDR